MRIRGSGDLSHTMGQRIDKILLFIGIGRSQVCDLLAHFRTADLCGPSQCQWMNLNDVVDHELHARESNAVGGQSPPAQSRRRVGEVEHDLSTSLRNLLRVD